MINDPLLPGRDRPEMPPPPSVEGADPAIGSRKLGGAARQKHPAMSARILATGISIASVITMTSNYTQAQKADEAAKAAAKAAADAAAKAVADAAAAQAAAAQAAALAAAQAAALAAAQAAADNRGVDGGGQTYAAPNYQAPVVITVPPAPATSGSGSGSPSTNQRSSGSN